MRIIAGTLRSRRLARPKTRDVRPMLDRVKESLFGHLASRVSGARVLDLFAGSGSLGLEALSRGACVCVFVEQRGVALQTIGENVSHLGLSGQVKIRRAEVLRELSRLGRRGESFDLVFIDPPYNKGLVKKALLALEASGILRPDSWVVVGHARQEPARAPELKTLILEETRSYGQACLSFFYHP